MDLTLSSALRARCFDKKNRNDVHAKLTQLAATRSALDVEIGEWLIAARDLALHVDFGFESFESYAHRMFGWDWRTVRERIRVAEKLEKLPVVRSSMLSGKMVWSVAKEISRIAESSEIEKEWVEKTEGKSARQVQRMTAGLRKDARPGDRKDPALLTHRRMFEFDSEQLAIFEGFLDEARSRTGESMSDVDALISAIAAKHVGAAGDAGVSRHQIAFVKRVGTDETYVSTSEGPMLVTPEVAERAACDATTIPATLLGEIVARASQSIPPSHRRQVVAESGGNCEVPGCGNCLHDIHHTKFLSDGGTHEIRFLIALCWYHHKRLHGGFLRIEGDRVAGYRFFQANGQRYGSMSGSPTTLRAIADAYEGLRRLGYKDPDARRACEAAAAELAADGRAVTGESVIERALRRKGERVYKLEKFVASPATKAGALANVGQSGDAALANVGHDTKDSNPAFPSPVGALANVGHVVESVDLEREAVSGLRSLRFREDEARACVQEALTLLIATGVTPTIERVLTEALRCRGRSMLAREGTGGGESVTGIDDVQYVTRRTAANSVSSVARTSKDGRRRAPRDLVTSLVEVCA